MKNIYILLFVPVTLLSCGGAQDKDAAVEATPVNRSSFTAVPQQCVDTMASVMPYNDSVIPYETVYAEPCVPVEPVKKTEKTVYPQPVSLSDEYNEGYEVGYDDGEDDASNLNGFMTQYDESCNYTGKKRCDYEEGYEDGYYDGFEDNRMDDGSDEIYE